ncbi:LINE-1 retrotransposable element ORF2 protein [Symbiodinium microadriaticum]|uniref:LINE-1 retrotransposable element ORF2 protein n=1 Tax=Symbiodinium microadriaticum TaxID=2951 RepID=A0A1Q9CR95_SYMMI|nr:LINE-1 retrotransposable element ORF2 protein [Symbiodinium microadriaticum]
MRRHHHHPVPLRLNAIRRDVHALAADFPSLLAQPWGLEPAAQHTFALADQQADHDRAIRLQHWQATTGEDFTRLCQWVRATVPSHSPHRPDADEWTAPLHPQAQAEHAATTWGDLWAPANLPQPEGFAQIRALIGLTAEFPLPSITGAAIFARFKATAKKSTGLDGWGASAFLAAGQAACDRLADLWAACLQHEAMPQIWKHIRVCLLPKPDGGLRPISIASAAYRTCMTCLLRSCRAWFLSWADRELIGGIPGRHTGQAHDALFSALTVSRQRQVAFVGAKQDVRKCFDSVVWDLAFQTWEWLGAPAKLVALLRCFYSDQKRWLAVRGHFARECIVPTRGILQGCPASVGLLNGLMLLWTRHLHAAVPSVSRSIYLDDRVMFAVGRTAAADVYAALRAAAIADRAICLTVHPDKLACWATRAPARHILAADPELCGPLVTSFRLLGVTYRLASGSGVVDSARLDKVVTDRCRRIAIAARALSARRRLLMSLVLSLVSWLGPWTVVPHQTANGWARSIEAAVGRIVSARSRFLLWSTWARSRLHPKFALAFAAVSHELRRVGGPSPPPDSVTACPALEASLAVFAWSILPGGTWRTPFGHFAPGFVTRTVLLHVAEDSWLRLLWAADPKTIGPLQADEHFALAFHRAVAVVYGAFLVATDGSALQAPAAKDLTWYQHAGWGIATSSDLGFFGVVPGLDRSAAAAERHALLTLACAANILETPVCVLTGNSALVTSFVSERLPADLEAYWALVRRWLPSGSSLHWVPAHGRHVGWASQLPLVSTLEARALNARADLSACAATEPLKPTFAADQRACKAAADWAELSVMRQSRLTHDWHETVAEQAKALGRLRDL